jgi:hypothetical protein
MEYRYGADGERAVKYGSNGNLPGMGGVYNYVNLHVYHYAGNNPVKYIDPDGREIEIEGNLFFKIKTVIALWRVEWNLKKSGDKVALEKFRALKKDPSYIVKIERTDNGNAYDFKNNIILFNDKKKTGGKDVTGDDKQPAFIRGEGLIPRPSGAVIKVLNPRPIPLENNIPRCFAAGLLIGLGHETAHAIDDHEGNIENNVRSPATAPEKYPNRAEEIAVGFENLLRGAYWKNRPEKLRPRY